MSFVVEITTTKEMNASEIANKITSAECHTVALLCGCSKGYVDYVLAEKRHNDEILLVAEAIVAAREAAVVTIQARMKKADELQVPLTRLKPSQSPKSKV